MSEIIYTITRKARRTTASIIVQPDKTVQVVAPLHIDEKEISKLVEKKKNWILCKLEELDKSELDLVQHTYQEGEKFLFMGNQLSLTITSGRGQVHKNGNSLIVATPPGLINDERKDYTRKKLLQWFMDQAKDILRLKTQEFGQQYGFNAIYVSVKEYKSRWGCCFSDGRIYFNWKIIMAPEPIIDYVVVHELCHFKEPNHSKKYWQHVEAIIPDWKSRRKWLHLNGHGLGI